MSLLDKYLRPWIEPPEGDYATLLRRSLEELIHLDASELGPVLDEMEGERQRARTQAQERFDQDHQEIDLYRQSETNQAQAQLDREAGDLRAAYEAQVQAIESQARAKREAANQAAAAALKASEETRREGLMEVQFLTEGDAERIAQGRREMRERQEQREADLAVWEATWLRCLQRYRLSRSLAPVAGSPDDPEADFESAWAAAEQGLLRLERLPSARLATGWCPWVWGPLLVLALALAGVLYGPAARTALLRGTLGGLAGVVGAGILWGVLRLHGGRAGRRLAAVAQAARQRVDDLARAQRDAERSAWQREENERRAERAAETQRIEAAFAAARTETLQAQERVLAAVEQARRRALRARMKQHNEAVDEIQGVFHRRRDMLNAQYEVDHARLAAQRDRALEEGEAAYDQARARLEARWGQALELLRRLREERAALGSVLDPAWDVPVRSVALPTGQNFPVVRLGDVRMDAARLHPAVRVRLDRDAAEDLCWPAVLAFPDRCSLLLQAGRLGRDRALDTLRAVMVRLFTSLPPGQVRFTIVDPVGLGESFAGFMHAGDYLESLVGGRIWTEAIQIQQQFEELTGHMENVIQKYLRNEFETIEDYNRQAGELAEPYRILVMADFPTHVTDESARRLSSILHSGPRCGVHTLILRDERQSLPDGFDLDELRARSVVLDCGEDAVVWQDPVMRAVTLTPDRAPDETQLTRIMHAVGRAGVDSARVEVPFEAVAPEAAAIWSRDSRRDLRVPLGRTGATRLQDLQLGRGMAQHLLIAGKTGSGKSTLLHVMITNLALWYSPDEVELYLVDFKKGVEFKGYATQRLPHARAVAIESDREFGLSILQRLDAELTRRGELFREAGVQDIGAYRDVTGRVLPRTVLIVDEFQVFFAEDDRLAQEASVLLEQLVRQGRAFGVHVILGSQTLGGAYGLARSTMGQMAVRIALQCSEADSQLILDDDNTAARLLTRPGEAIYNDAGGQIVGNSPFQTAWLSDATRDTYLAALAKRRGRKEGAVAPMIVFEGNAPADLRANVALAACLADPGRAPEPPRLWLGDPVAIKEPTAAPLARQSGSNLLIVGQRDEAALNLMRAAVLGLAAQLSTERLRFVILDGSPPEAGEAAALAAVAAAVPQAVDAVAWRDVEGTIRDLATEVDRRIEADERGAPTVILLIYGLQRYRSLRRNEDSFSLSLDTEAEPQAGARLADLLREGPTVGVHSLVWADTLASVERHFDRHSLREFDYRVLFQVSAADSSNLIDSPAASQLGFHRALFYSEVRGTAEIFRPYAAPDPAWLAEIARRLGA